MNSINCVTFWIPAYTVNKEFPNNKKKGENMNPYLILFHSMTSVLKGREALRRRGISSRVIRTPAQLRRRSCGYSLRVRVNPDEALDIIHNAGVQTVGTAAADDI